MNNKNLVEDDKIREFYVWVDEKNFLVKHNIKFTKSLTVISVQEGEDLITFVPNPNRKAGFLSPFQYNLISDYWTEYNLELTKRAYFKNYPSRLEALFLLDTLEDAKQYKKTHERHVAGRTLKKVRSNGKYKFSKHDVGWIDFLHEDVMFDDKTIHNVSNEYWNGNTVKDISFTLRGESRTFDSVYELLYIGRVDILDSLETITI